MKHGGRAKARVYITILLFVLLTAALVIAAFPLQRYISEKLEIVKGEAIAYLEEFFGRSISYDSISPSIFRCIEVRGLTIHSDGVTAPELLSIARIRVFYRPMKVIRGDKSEILREVRIENSSFSIDMDRDRDLLDLLKEIQSGSSSFPDITVSGKNLTLSLVFGDIELHLDKFFFELNPSGSLLELEGKCSAVAASAPGIAGIHELSTDIRVSGALEKDYSTSDVTIDFSRVSSSMFDLRNITLHAEHSGKRITLQKIQDKAPFDILLDLDIDNGVIAVSLNSEDFIPYTYLTPGEDLAGLAPWFTTVFSGRADLQYLLETGAVTYDMDLTARAENVLLPVPFYIVLDCSGDLAEVHCRRLQITSVYGLWGFRGTVTPGKPFPVPEGTLWISEVPLGDSEIASIMTISRDGPAIGIRSSDTTVGGITLERTAIELIPYEDDLDFLVTTYLNAEDETPLFTGEGNLQIQPEVFLQASAEIDKLPLGPVSALFTEQERLSRAVDSVVFSTHLFISTDLDRFSFTTSEVVFSDPGQPENRVSFALSGNNSGFQLNRIQALWNESRLNGKASLAMNRGEGLEAGLSIVFRDIPYACTASWHPDTGLLLDGDYGLRASLMPSRNLFEARLSCENFPVPMKDGITYLTLAGDGTFSSSGMWKAYLREGVITGLPLPVRENRLSISGKADPDRITFYRIIYTDSLSSVSGRGVIDTSIFDATGSGWMELADGENRENYIIQVERAENIDASFRIAGAPLSRFTSGGLSGLASGSLRFAGDPDNPSIDLEALIEDGTFNGDPFSGSAVAGYDGSLFNCSNLDLRFMNNNLEDFSFTYDLGTGFYSGGGSLRGIMRTEKIGAILAVSGRTLPGTTITDIPSILKEKVEGSLSIDRITKGNTAIDPWDVAFTAEQGNLHVEGGPELSLRADILADKTFTLELNNPLPLRGRAEGKIEKSTIEADISEVDLDVQILDTIMRIPQFRFLEGHAEGYLKVSGSFNDPEIWGSLDATEIMAENPFVYEKIGPFDAVLEFDEKSLTISNAVLTAGKARAVADITFNIDHWVTESLEIDIQTLSQEGIHIVQSFGRMNVDGYARGNLNMNGDPNILYLTGDLEALSTVVTIRSPDEEKKPLAERRRFLIADINLTTGKGVEFLWPSRTLPVLRTFAETGQELTVHYDNTRDQLRIQGEVGIKGGQIYYVQRNFYIRDGTIVFNENQDKFDPLLSTTAEIREITTEGESAKIFLIVEENALSTFQPRFESEPVMSTSEILTLLGGRMFYAADSGGMDIAQAVALTGDFVGQFGLIRSFEERVKSIFNIDLFTLRSPVVSNILLEKILPAQSGTGSTEPESLGKYLDNTTLFLGKYFGNDLFLQAILRLDFYDQVAGGLDSPNDMFLDTEITLEWKTPVTLIEFSLFPDLSDESGDILKPSLGLSWRYSY